MTNLEIIKYLAHNNPTRLAEFLDDIYCHAWNCGAYAQRNIEEDKISELEMEFSESKWLEQEADTNFYFDHELEQWSKAINPAPALEVFYGSKSKVIDQAIDEIKLLETIQKTDKYSDSVYNSFRKEVCTGCHNRDKCLQSKMAIIECPKFENYYEI